MRLPILVAATLAAPLTLPAETLRGIPADVDAAVHISYDLAAKSQLHGAALALQKRMEKAAAQADPAAAKRNQELMDRLGLKTNSTHVIDIGFRALKPAGGEGPDAERLGDFFGVCRIDLRKSVLDAFAKAEGVAPLTVGGATGWEFSKLGAALGKALGADDTSLSLLTSSLDDYAVVMPEDGVLVLAPVRELGKALDCWNGRKPSHELPGDAQGIIAATPLAHTQAHAGIRKIQQTIDPESLKDDKVGLRDGAFAMGEDSKELIIHVQAGFVDTAKAATAAQQVNASLAIGNLATAEAEEDDAETKFYKGEAAAFIAGITVRQDGDKMVIRSAFPLSRAKVLFEKLGEKAEQALREAAAGQAGAAPSEDEEMDAPAKPAGKTTK